MKLLKEIGEYQGKKGRSGWKGGEGGRLRLEGFHSGVWSEVFLKLFTKIAHFSSLKTMWPKVYREP